GIEIPESLALELRLTLEDGVLRVGEHAVQTTEDGERQDHILVLAALEGVADEVRDAPEEADDLAVVHGHTLRSVVGGASRQVVQFDLLALGAPAGLGWDPEDALRTVLVGVLGKRCRSSCRQPASHAAPLRCPRCT